jgi:hypothetical protein
MRPPPPVSTTMPSVAVPSGARCGRNQANHRKPSIHTRISAEPMRRNRPGAFSWHGVSRGQGGGMIINI